MSSYKGLLPDGLDETERIQKKIFRSVASLVREGARLQMADVLMIALLLILFVSTVWLVGGFKRLMGR